MRALAARDTFSILERGYLGPGLHTLGFNGGRGSYAADRPETFVRLGLQRSAFGDRRETQFTVNVTVVSKAAWQSARDANQELPAEPAANTGYGTRWFDGQIWQSRIGLLMPAKADRWWSINEDSDLVATADDVLHSVRAWVLPAVEARSTRRLARDIP